MVFFAVTTILQFVLFFIFHQKYTKIKYDDIYLDTLTKLYNRKYLEEASLAILQHFSYRTKYIGAAMIDIDFFKRMNDTYGHEEGDCCLREVGMQLFLLKMMYLYRT